jgi:quinol monooxygenase YgiN
MRARRGSAHGAALFHVLGSFPELAKKVSGSIEVIYVVATLTIKPETRADFIAAATACIKETRKEPGNIAYDLHESVTDPAKMVFVEQWENAEALVPHRGMEHMKTFGRVAVKCMSAPPKIEIITPEKVDVR